MVEEMKIRDGYKKIEVGVIPEDWEVKAIKDLALVKGGKRLPKGRNLINKVTSYPYIKVADMYFGGVEIDSIQYITKEVYDLIKNYTISNNDIFISVAGTLGIIGKIPDSYDGANLTENADKLTNISCDRDYLMYYLMSNDIQREIKKQKTTAAQPKLALTRIKNFIVAMPKNTKEQKAIAKALSDMDDLIESTQKLIDKKKKIKQGTMQELLTGKKRLDGFSGEWEVKKLGEIVDFYKGKGLPKSEISIEGKYKCIHYGELFTLYKEKIKLIFSKTDKFENKFLSIENDVLMPTSDVTPNGLAKASCILESGIILGGDILVIRSNHKEIDGVFLSYLIRNDKIQIMQLVTGTTVYHLYASDMKEFKFKLPPLKEQKAIAQILSDMDSEIELQQQKLEKYKTIKKGMMQELLTGRIRLV